MLFSPYIARTLISRLFQLFGIVKLTVVFPFIFRFCSVFPSIFTHIFPFLTVFSSSSLGSTFIFSVFPSILVVRFVVVLILVRCNVALVCVSINWLLPPYTVVSM